MDCPHCNHVVDLEAKCRNPYCYNYEKHGERVMNYNLEGHDGGDHYGPYGNHCMNMGHFDAGECWLCYIKRLKAQRSKIAAWFIEQPPTLDVDWKSLQTILEIDDDV